MTGNCKISYHNLHPCSVHIFYVEFWDTLQQFSSIYCMSCMGIVEHTTIDTMYYVRLLFTRADIKKLITGFIYS